MVTVSDILQYIVEDLESHLMTVHELDEPSALAVFKKVVLESPTQSIPGLLISKYELLDLTESQVT